MLAKAHVLKKEYDKAESALKKVLSHDQQYLAAHKMLADILVKTGWESTAVEHYSAVLEIDPLEEKIRDLMKRYASKPAPKTPLLEPSEDPSTAVEEEFPPVESKSPARAAGGTRNQDRSRSRRSAAAETGAEKLNPDPCPTGPMRSGNSIPTTAIRRPATPPREPRSEKSSRSFRVTSTDPDRVPAKPSETGTGSDVFPRIEDLFPDPPAFRPDAIKESDAAREQTSPRQSPGENWWISRRTGLIFPRSRSREDPSRRAQSGRNRRPRSSNRVPARADGRTRPPAASGSFTGPLFEKDEPREILAPSDLLPPAARETAAGSSGPDETGRTPGRPPPRENRGIHGTAARSRDPCRPPAEPQPAARSNESLRPPPKAEDKPELKIVTSTLGEIYAVQGQFDKAIQVYEALLEKNPNDQKYLDKIADLKKKLREASGK